MTEAVVVKPAGKDLAFWREQAVRAGERLQIAETQLKDLRGATDDMRARMTKYKGRLESAQQRINELQAQLIAVSAERDALAARVARQDAVKRKVHEFRQSILDGPLWELFSEL